MNTAEPYAELLRLARRGRKAEQRSEAVQGCFTTIAKLTLSYLFGGWMVMLAAGVIHDEWIHALPTVGYWWAVLVVFLLRGVFSHMPATNTKKGATP